MITNTRKRSGWGSRRMDILMLLCYTIGISCTENIPAGVITLGTIGSLLCIAIFFVVLGIPLLYMETVVSQFTARDCLEVWTIRKCLSHIGYVQVFCQIIYVIYNHTIVSFILHYFLISFEKHIPFYSCGPWATNDCNILVNNYTVNKYCIHGKFSLSFCDELYTTYPEFQYWRYYILKVRRKEKLVVVWRACLASGLACVIMYVSCFKRRQSMKYFVNFFAIYPICTYIVFTVGSMFQKGIVVKYEELLDLDFSIFMEKFRFSYVILRMVFTLGIGSGVMFNLTSSANFRSPCFANVVICVAVTTAFIILTVCATIMLHCPYGYQYGIKLEFITKTPMSLLFEKVPRLIRQYKNGSTWLLLIYSCNIVMGLSTNAVMLFNLLEMARERNLRISNYPGLMCLCTMFVLFFITIPLQSNIGINVILHLIMKYLNLLATFITIIECVVFIIWYGIHRFSEDVHFMHGVQPSIWIKIGWLSSGVLLTYAFCIEIYYRWKNRSLIDVLGRYLLFAVGGFIVLGVIFNLLLAAFRKRFSNEIALDPSWGPKSLELQRSRAMFTAQAMTKEYLYRQYHLQAGIMARQRKANIRSSWVFNEDLCENT